MNYYYRLNDQGEPVSTTADDWIMWYANCQNEDAGAQWALRVAISIFSDWTVSTIFVGLNRNHFLPNGQPPLLWESMVFGPPPFSNWTQRYSSRLEAELGHERMLAAVLSNDTSALDREHEAVRKILERFQSENLTT